MEHTTLLPPVLAPPRPPRPPPPPRPRAGGPPRPLDAPTRRKELLVSPYIFSRTTNTHLVEHRIRLDRLLDRLDRLHVLDPPQAHVRVLRIHRVRLSCLLTNQSLGM